MNLEKAIKLLSSEYERACSLEFINDFGRCDDLWQLRFVMENINRNRYQLISVTQDSEDVFTVFFRRCAVG